MKKLIFRGPIQTASGYGVHARMLLKALDESGKFDITAMSVPWGATPLIYDDSEEQKRIKELSMKFNPQAPGEFDISVQVTIPNEFMKLAPKNVCVTAGIETDRVSPVWQQKSNEFADVVVVPSVHSARSFNQGIYNGMKGPDQVLLRKPLYILPEWVNADVFNTAPVDVLPGLEDMPDFNFITVGLGMEKAEGEDRKNITLLVRWFCEQFKNSTEVGLVLKVSMVNASELDFKNTRERIKSIKQQTGCGQFPRIKLIHGRLSDGELAALYKHPKVKAFITTTHGEGFGLPIIEAASCGLPVIATNWSGHLDFLNIDGKKKFVPLDVTLAPIPDGCVWEHVLDKGTAWANVNEQDVKMKMAKVVLSYQKPKEWATELAAYIPTVFNKQLGADFAEDVYKLACNEKVQLTKNMLVKTKPSDKVLPVTLVCLTDFKLDEHKKAIDNSTKQIGFEKILHITDVKLGSVAAYDTYVAKELAPRIDTSHALLIQHDGYVLNGSAWDDKFLEYDMVGAPWYWQPASMNSGCMLISKKLLTELQSPEYEPITPFDLTLFKEYRTKLEEKGFKFAPPEVSSRFSVENQPYTGSFAWHGENAFWGEQ